ncbi:hypothetical protein [Aeromonas sp. FL131]|uniref:hypothetical protein n=1 Tax=Aeromonas sp. FL131 TaxID=3416715 RepID=UPI003CFB351B
MALRNRRIDGLQEPISSDLDAAHGLRLLDVVREGEQTEPVETLVLTAFTGIGIVDVLDLQGDFAADHATQFAVLVGCNLFLAQSDVDNRRRLGGGELDVTAYSGRS